MGATHFLMKTLPRVAAETALHVPIHLGAREVPVAIVDCLELAAVTTSGRGSGVVGYKSPDGSMKMYSRQWRHWLA